MRLKPWHLIAIAGLCYACTRPKKSPPVGAIPPEPLPGEPLPDLFVFAHDRALIPIARAAARRIETASGIKVHINEYGTQPTALPIFGSDFLCGSGTEGRAGPYGIALARDCNVDPELVLLHELMHQLGVGHLELPARGVMNEATDSPLDRISEDDLTALCAVRACSKFQPET